MAALHPARAAPATPPLSEALRQCWACWWWRVRAHVADLKLLPSAEAIEPGLHDGWVAGGLQPR